MVDRNDLKQINKEIKEKILTVRQIGWSKWSKRKNKEIKEKILTVRQIGRSK